MTPPLTHSLLPPCEAVILDLDGLLLDTEPTYLLAWRQAAAELGVALPADFGDRVSGRQAAYVDAELLRLMGEIYNASRFHAIAESCWRKYIASRGIACMPGLDLLMSTLEDRQLPYAVATNSPRHHALECLRVAGVGDRFATVIGVGDVAHGKPEPDLVLEAARRLSVSPKRCWMLEDSETGLQAAARAGAQPILVKSGPRLPELDALAVGSFASLAEVADLIGDAAGSC